MSLITNKTQLDVIDRFVRDLESSLGVAAEKVSFDDLWNSTVPDTANGLSLQEFMKNVRFFRSNRLCLGGCFVNRTLGISKFLLPRRLPQFR